MPRLAIFLVIFAALAALAPAAHGQGAVAFQPSIGVIPDGVILNVTPVVSADRRYVRMTLNPTFISNVSFQTFLIPAAVSNGGIAGVGGFGGGVGGGLGGGVGGGPSGIGTTTPSGMSLGAGPLTYPGYEPFSSPGIVSRPRVANDLNGVGGTVGRATRRSGR